MLPEKRKLRFQVPEMGGALVEKRHRGIENRKFRHTQSVDFVGMRAGSERWVVPSEKGHEGTENRKFRSVQSVDFVGMRAEGLSRGNRALQKKMPGMAIGE